MDNPFTEYEYSASFEFDGLDENRIIRLRARAMCP